MRIGLLHYSVPPVVGGVESVLAKHAVLIADAGHKVCVIAGRGSQFDPRVVFHQIPLVDSMHARVLAVKKSLDAGAVPVQMESVTNEIGSSLDPLLRDLDVLIVHNVCSLHKNLALTAALRKRSESGPLPILWHHDLAWCTPRYRHELHNGFPWDLIRQDWPRAIHVAVSEFRRDQLAILIGLRPEQIRVIPNGVDIAQLLSLSDQTVDLVRRLDLLQASPFILLPVRITRRKNIELAIRVVAKLRESFPRVKLVITGPPGPHNASNQEYFNHLKELRESLSLLTSVHFLADVVSDYLPEESIFGLLRLADLLLMPSFEEGFGLPVIEASQLNVPVFCSDIDPLRALAGDNACFFLPESDPDHVASMIQSSLSTSRQYLLRMNLRKYEWSRIYSEIMEPMILGTGEPR